MQDLLELDRRGIPAVACFSEEFESGVVAGRTLHGFDASAVYVRHPIQPLNDDELHQRAEEIFDAVLASITRAA